MGPGGEEGSSGEAEGSGRGAGEGKMCAGGGPVLLGCGVEVQV